MGKVLMWRLVSQADWDFVLKWLSYVSIVICAIALTLSWLYLPFSLYHYRYIILVLFGFIYGIITGDGIAALAWNLSEYTGIGLGRFAPFVFGKMIGRKGKRIK